MNRRDLISGAAAVSCLAAFRAHPVLAQDEGIASHLRDVWTAWREANMASTGRVIDGPQQGASHSEGQGYGMLIAAIMGDRRAFDRMDVWARVNLGIRSDSLLAWRWLPDLAGHVPDLNNASDGDLFRAWALLLASRRFGVGEYRDAAGAIASDLAESCIFTASDGEPLLLPAARGFTTDAGAIINPCYAMPLALTELATEFNLPVLARAARKGGAIAAELAAEGVVPDWVEVANGTLRPAEGFSFDAGYEAMRLPLFLIWSGLSDHPAVLRYAEAQTRAPQGTAATVIDRATGDILSTGREAGYKAIAALSTCAAENRIGSEIPPYAPGDPYYPATMQVFAMIAQAKGSPMCIPL
ncbi:glycosyl hydrolase family 8 [Salipiger mucosus]|uniref:cellulase n=1 Tax=Salipiger mucosus DSM 16094 TaxID=1123237 RepID=S9RQN1_9RHOB|nr:glycosyl hydrolase family 8 [Salipiger mucosus]EPX80370.1 Endoglucanase precursor [Salipiger mucosus DSM 16094]